MYIYLHIYEYTYIYISIYLHIFFKYTYLETPKGHNFSLKWKNRLWGFQTEISVWRWFQAKIGFSGWKPEISGWKSWISGWNCWEVRLKPGKLSSLEWLETPWHMAISIVEWIFKVPPVPLPCLPFQHHRIDMVDDLNSIFKC